MNADEKGNPEKKSSTVYDGSRNLAAKLGMNIDLSKSKFPKTKANNEVYSRPKTISGRIAFLLDQDDEGSIQEYSNEIYPIKKRKPKTITGKVAFVCGARKSTIRSTLSFLLIFIIVISAAFYIRFKKSNNVINYWEEKPSSDPVEVLYKQYKGKAVEVYKAMPEKRRKAIRKTIEGNDQYRDKAREVYNSLSDTKKKEVRKYIDNK